MIQHMEVRKVKHLISRVVKRVFSAVKVKYEKIIAISWQKITAAGETGAFEWRPKKNINEIKKFHYTIIQTKARNDTKKSHCLDSTRISRADCQLLQQMRRERRRDWQLTKVNRFIISTDFYTTELYSNS